MNPRTRRMHPLLLVLPLLAMGGCGLLTPGADQTVDVAGRVVVAGTGEPIAGLGVMLDRGSGGPARFVVATTRTDASGVFRIVYEADERNPFTFFLTINAEPYDPRYFVATRSVPRGEQRDLGTIELRLNDAP